MDVSYYAATNVQTVPFRVQRLHRQFQQGSQNQKCIFDKKIIQGQLVICLRVCGVEVEIIC